MKAPRSHTFLTNSSVYLLSNILSGIIPFLLLPILTRYLPPAEYGKVAMFQTLLGALGAIVGNVFVGSAGRKYYDNDVDQIKLAEFIGCCIQLIIACSIIAAFTLYIFQVKFSQWLGIEPLFLFLAVFTALCTAITSIRLSQWQVRKESVKYGVLQISKSTLNMLLSILFVVILLYGASGRIGAQVFVGAVFLFISLQQLHKDRLLTLFVWRKTYIMEALKFGIPMIPHTAGAFLLSAVDRIVINNEIGLAEAGLYMVAIQLTSAIALVFDAINKAYVPWLFEKLKEDNLIQKKGIVRSTYIWFCVIILGAILSFMVGPPLVVLIAGEQYTKAGQVIGWLVLGQSFQGMYLMVTNYIFYSKKTGLLSLASLSSGILNLLLLVFLVRIIGLKGAAIAFAISMSIRFLLTWWVAQKLHPMPWFDFRKI